MTVRLEGMEELQKNLRQWGINADKELGQIVRATTLAVQAEAVQSIQQERGIGQFVTRYGPKRQHLASAPGQSPNSDTGRLAGSVDVRFIPKIGGLLSGVVFTPLEYGAHLEFGTQEMAARPWLIPAVESQRGPWIKRLNRLTEKAAKGINRL